LNIIVIIKCAHALLYLTSMRIRPQFKLWFVDEEGEYVFGLGTMGLLAEIDKLGSISAATRKLGMSYRYALERITIVEKRLGRQLVDRTRGGKEGGGAKLTAFGYELLADYRGMEGSLNQLRSGTLTSVIDRRPVQPPETGGKMATLSPSDTIVVRFLGKDLLPIVPSRNLTQELSMANQ